MLHNNYNNNMGGYPPYNPYVFTQMSPYIPYGYNQMPPYIPYTYPQIPPYLHFGYIPIQQIQQIQQNQPIQPIQPIQPMSSETSLNNHNTKNCDKVIDKQLISEQLLNSSTQTNSSQTFNNTFTKKVVTNTELYIKKSKDKDKSKIKPKVVRFEDNSIVELEDKPKIKTRVNFKDKLENIFEVNSKVKFEYKPKIKHEDKYKVESKVESKPTHKHLPILEIGISESGRNLIKQTDPEKIKASEYRFSKDKSVEINALEYLRSNYSQDDYVICPSYGSDTQCFLSETPKDIDKLPKDTALRCLDEEANIIANKNNLEEDTIRNRRQRFILDLNLEKNLNVKSKCTKYKPNSQNTNDDKKGDVHDKVRSLVIVVGKANRLKKLLEYAKPNDGIRGYHLVPIFHPLLDLLVKLN